MVVRTDPKPRDLSEEQFRAVLEERVQRAFHMSAREFSLALKERRIDPESSKAAGLAILLSAQDH
jgi:hypothetical protein